MDESSLIWQSPHKRRFIMNKKITESTSGKKYYLFFETDEEGIRQYKAASEQACVGTSLSKMRVDGKMVPAIKLEVDKATYDTFKKDQRMKEYRYKLFSAVTDGQGNEDSFDPASPYPINQADEYMELLYGLISFIKVHHPKYSKYTELVELLGQEYTLKEASVILGKPYRTLYGWTLTLRPIFDNYRNTISHS